MDYTTGTYIMRTRKIWKCESCQQNIIKGIKCFARIKEYGEELSNQNGEKYKLKTYNRYHLNCAEQLTNLNPYEQNLITTNIKVRHI